MLKKALRYQKVLADFATTQEFFFLDRDTVFEKIAKIITKELQINRLGIWLYDNDLKNLEEILTFVPSEVISRGNKINLGDIPQFHNYLLENRLLVTNHAPSDPRLVELRDNYIKEFSIESQMDFGLYEDGRPVGVVCFTNTHHIRDWDEVDILFAQALANFIGRHLEAQVRHQYANELKDKIHYLENNLKRKIINLNETNMSLDLALEGAQLGKWDWHIRDQKLILNKTWFTGLGYQFNELPQAYETFQKVVHPDDLPRVEKTIQNYLDGKTGMYECRFRMIKKNGDFRWVLDRGRILERDNEGKPIRLIGVNVDISPMVKLEQALLSSEEQLKGMIGSLPIPIAMVDRNLRYAAFSDLWKTSWEKNAKEGESLSNLQIPDWVNKMKSAFNGSTLSETEELITLTTGENLWLRWSIQPWRSPKGNVNGVIVMAENITSKMEAQVKLTQASKLSALGEMAGGIAHEINNPLGIIKGYVDLLKRQSSRKMLKPDTLSSYLSKIDGTVGRIFKIVNGMRRFARDSADEEKRVYSLNKIITETLELCQEKINNSGTIIKVEQLPNDGEILCHPVEVSQVILNLINNSFQATQSYSHPWIHIKLQDLGPKYEIKVIDCGEGIASEVQQKLFQPFFTTKDIGVGTGLGLSISRGIIEAMEGKLFYESSAPHTTFVIEIPKLEEMNTSLS